MPIGPTPTPEPRVRPKSNSPLAVVISQTITRFDDQEVSASSAQTSQETILLVKTPLYTVLEHEVEDDEFLFSSQREESLNTRVDTLEIHFDWLAKRVESLRQMLEDIRGDICCIEGKLDGLESRPSVPPLVASH